MRSHLSKLVRFSEAIRAAVRRILALEVQISTSLTRRVSVALDLPAFTFVAMSSVRRQAIETRTDLRSDPTHHAIEI